MTAARTLGTLVAASLTLLCAMPNVSAQDAMQERDPLQFMIDAPDLVGERVRVRGGAYQASFDSVYLALPGGKAILEGPWTERGDFARLIPICEGYEPTAECEIVVEGRVDRMLPSDSSPILTNVDFIFDE